MHRPGRPNTPAPPETLRTLVDRISHGSVAQKGITTTEDGEWALLVRVYPNQASPAAYLQAQAHGIPVIMEEVGDAPVARPAYPAKGE